MSLKGLLGRDRITISLLVCLFQWTSVFCIGHQQMSKWRKAVTEWGGALFQKLTGGGYGVSRSALKHFNCRTKFLPNWSKCDIYTTQCSGDTLATSSEWQQCSTLLADLAFLSSTSRCLVKTQHSLLWRLRQRLMNSLGVNCDERGGHRGCCSYVFMYPIMDAVWTILYWIENSLVTVHYIIYCYCHCWITFFILRTAASTDFVIFGVICLSIVCIF